MLVEDIARVCQRRSPEVVLSLFVCSFHSLKHAVAIAIGMLVQLSCHYNDFIAWIRAKMYCNASSSRMSA